MTSNRLHSMSPVESYHDLCYGIHGVYHNIHSHFRSGTIFGVQVTLY